MSDDSEGEKRHIMVKEGRTMSFYKKVKEAHLKTHGVLNDQASNNPHPELKYY